MTRATSWAALVVLLVLSPSPARAAPITFDFTGSVTQTNFDPSDPFGGTIGFGTALTGSYTFEATTLDSAPADLTTGAYLTAGPPYGATVTIGGNTFSTTDSLAIVVANFILSPDQYGVLACALNQGACSTGPLTINLFFQDNQGTVFATDAQPLLPPPLSAFEIRDFHLIRNLTDSAGTLTQQDQIDGVINSLTLHQPSSAVPEPGTLGLVGSGLGGLAALWWRRRRQG